MALRLHARLRLYLPGGLGDGQAPRWRDPKVRVLLPPVFFEAAAHFHVCRHSVACVYRDRQFFLSVCEANIAESDDRRSRCQPRLLESRMLQCEELSNWILVNRNIERVLIRDYSSDDPGSITTVTSKPRTALSMSIYCAHRSADMYSLF